MTLSPQDHKKREDAIKQLVKEVGERTDALDELVHEAKAEEAATINNEGAESQIRFLYESWSPAEAEKTLRETLGLEKLKET